MVSRGRVRAPPWLLPHVVIPGFIPGIFIRDTHVDGRNTCSFDVIVTTPFAACSERTYISPDTEPRPTMERIGASEARRHGTRALDRVTQDESLTSARHGKPVARLLPVPHYRERAREATVRIVERGKHLQLAIADLIAKDRGNIITATYARPLGGNLIDNVKRFPSLHTKPDHIYLDQSTTLIHLIKTSIYQLDHPYFNLRVTKLSSLLVS